MLLSDDDTETLEAALSFVDTFDDGEHNPHLNSLRDSSWDDDLNQLVRPSAGSVVCSSPELSGRLPLALEVSNKNQAIKAKKRRRRHQENPNRARDERRNELAYLRVKVKQLESELGSLHGRVRSSTGPQLTSHTLTGSSSSGTEGKPHVWRGIATRQLKRRERSERENAKLKMVLESQVKLAKSLETLLRRKFQKQMAGCAEMPGSYCPQGSSLSLLANKSAFDSLLRCVERSYEELSAVFARNSLLGSETPSQEARMREDNSGMYLDVFATKLFPFEFEAVASAVWSHFRGNGKHNGEVFEKVYENATTDAEDSDTVMEAFTIENTDEKNCAKFRYKQVVRRYVESDRQVVVWVARGHSLPHKDSPFTGMEFVEKGYVVTRRPRSGHTVVQMCTLMLPQMASGSIKRAVAGRFTDFVLNVVAASASRSQELIENVLLEQTLNARRDLNLAQHFT